eukprot:TRINITY_DN3963_c0_g1_i1.p5 TRINITY_DN3963_c0_g1~~TRINITY_DN3963_c0_g1_i1.p5  ORF type:complete len:53 (-),score=10.16 TRINITY_DN3963_c0_g1_i1:156-314(-)
MTLVSNVPELHNLNIHFFGGILQRPQPLPHTNTQTHTERERGIHKHIASLFV